MPRALIHSDLPAPRALPPRAGRGRRALLFCPLLTAPIGAYGVKEESMNTVKAICAACEGTGLYRGMAEPEGVAVVCLRCEGTGCQEIRYEPFVARKKRRGIRRVQRSRGTSILGCGPVGGSVSYEEFWDGFMP